MPTYLKLSMLAAFLAALSGCVTLHTDVDVKEITKLEKGPKVITFTEKIDYMPELTIALSSQGFTVKPMLSQQEITELQSGSRIARFNDASARFGISVTTQWIGHSCSFTGPHAIYDFTVVLTDLATNQVAQILKQRGADGPCRPSKPVFDSIAEALARNW